MIGELNRYIAPLKRKILSMIGKALIEAVNDNTKLQTVKISLLKDELADEVDRVQNFGFTSNPPVNSEAVAISAGGDRGNMIVIVVDNSETRLTGLESGESAIYNAFETFIKLLKDKKIIIQGDNIFIGGETGSQPIPLGTNLKAYLDSFITEVWNVWVPTGIPADTTTLKTLVTTWLGTHLLDNYLSTKHKVN